MTITLTPELENAIGQKARQTGARPEQVAMDGLNQLFLTEGDGESPGSLSDFLVSIAGTVHDLPSDMADNHGHYIHGAATLAERMGQFIGAANDLPIDMAENHDHYIRGAPKR